MKQTSQALQAELEQIIEWFESDAADIDGAEDKYRRGLEIAQELTSRLQSTKSTITKLKQSFAE